MTESTPRRYTGVRQRHSKGCAQAQACKCKWAFVAEAVHAGRRVQATGSGFSSAREASKARAVALADLQRHPVAKRGQTVAGYLASWLERKEATGSLRPSTARAYGSHVTLYLVPILGAVKLADLNVSHLDHLRDELRRTRPDMSAATTMRVFATLRSALRDAFRRDEITDDPTRRMERIKTTRPRFEVWQPADLGRFLDWVEMKGERLAPVVEFTAMSGLRRGEVLGLRWVDVDLDRARLVVAQQAIRVGAEVLVGAPKTAAGEQRVVDLDAGTVARLRTWRTRQEAERAEFGDAWQDFGLVFTWQDGRPLNADDLTKRFPKLIERFNEDRRLSLLAADAPERRTMMVKDPARMALIAQCEALAGPPLSKQKFHALRHLQASLMLASGAPMALVSKRLGHSSIVLTTDTYTHMLDGVGAQAATAAAALIPRRSAGVS